MLIKQKKEDMAILNFRPHTLWVEKIFGGYYDKMGDWHQGESKWIAIGDVGSQPADTRNPTVPIPDGQVVVYDYVLHLPADCEEFLYGQRVKISLYGDTERIYSVVGFQRLQLQSKLYIRGVG